MDESMQVQVFAPNGVVLARPPSPIKTMKSRYMTAAGGNLPNILDMMTGLHLSLPFQTAVICSQGACTRKSLRLLEHSGVRYPADVRAFRSGSEAIRLAKEAARRGELLEFQFPPQDPELRAAHARVSPDLLETLNKKTILDSIIAPQYLPHRVVASPAEVRRLVEKDRRPAVIKPVGKEVNNGIAIFTRRLGHKHNRSIYSELEDISDQWIVEEEVAFQTVWGLQFAVLDNGTVEFLGWSVHLPQPTNTWVGCILDNDQPPPELVEAVAAGVRTASGMGYRGYCSFDAGISRTGELRVIDPNFRVSGATSAVVHRHLLAHRHECLMATFWSLPPGIDAEPKLAPFIDRGELIVLMHYDPAETDNPVQPAQIYGVVGAANRHECGVLVARIQRALT